MKKFLLTLSMVLAASATFAVPAKPIKKVLTLADGTQITATLHGDEFLNWWEADNGSRYVASAEDNNVYVAANMDVMKATAEARRAPISQARAERMAKVRSNAMAAKNGGPLRVGIGADHITYTGKKKGIIILVQFADTKFATGHDNAYYDMVANERNLKHSDGYIGSVSDWFLDQSNGKFELDFDVKGPYTLKHTASYYGKNSTTSDDKVGYMIRDACDSAAVNGTNFNDYDWDGDGYADQVFVLYAGRGEATGGGAETVWPHMYKVGYTVIGRPLSYTSEGKGKVNTYACSNEIDPVYTDEGYWTGALRPAGIGTICHEFSHCLGYPDMYDTDNSSGNYGCGEFDVMCSGSYNGNGFIPCNYTAYERIYAGWTEPIELNEPATVNSMISVTDYGRPFILYNDKNNDEYFLLENRQPTGWDQAIYGSNGLLITHIDYDKTVWDINKVNGSKQDHQRCALVPADNSATKMSLDDVRNDLYPYVSDNEVQNDEFTDDSRPAAKLYNKNADGTKYLGKPITGIARNGDGTMSFVVMDGDDNNILDNTPIETGISGVTTATKNADSRVYSIDGLYMGNDINKMGKGLYIVGGKKELKNK